MFDFQHFIEMLPDIWKAFGETLQMIGISVAFAILFGIPLGIILFITNRGLFLENRLLNGVLGFVINLVRSIPFLILIVALIPLTRLIVGETIGPIAASVSLSIAAIPFLARIVETSLREIDKGVIEAAIAIGATPWMIIKGVLLPEAKSSIIQGITLTIISLIAFSAMAGTVGGGGIGDLAVRFGYYRYDNTIMISTIVILVILVQLLQQAGDLIAKVIDKR
ncbi:methionine ABC transporter permease [Lederbergia galactosidilytica]|uniref:Methionine ABC transporter permease n=1 Tax=Lederbergia galactosidilytica TaxID=217031 RepID=A0A0Q9XZ33_9BACI|nr:methionine ABC transporter permease [Lederbergia galactosidilytica]KRG14043.1 methionine ABC transporter permease [Lederbergia galactosidilytica]KRG16511.1 methionine ABC transporter permease [Virgibacillus soli]MBP1914155.1 D-methionine transport system permease protein [Lederbergia galactosidilytica]OAK67386.1 methionine ABC transporter permease [Lederbergia galactosidilytica]